MDPLALPSANKAALLGHEQAHSPTVLGKRRIVDLLPDSFAVERSEAEWLMTLLGHDELRYIFGEDDGKTQD